MITLYLPLCTLCMCMYVFIAVWCEYRRSRVRDSEWPCCRGTTRTKAATTPKRKLYFWCHCGIDWQISLEYLQVCFFPYIHSVRREKVRNWIPSFDITGTLTTLWMQYWEAQHTSTKWESTIQTLQSWQPPSEERNCSTQPWNKCNFKFKYYLSKKSKKWCQIWHELDTLHKGPDLNLPDLNFCDIFPRRFGEYWSKFRCIKKKKTTRSVLLAQQPLPTLTAKHTLTLSHTAHHITDSMHTQQFTLVAESKHRTLRLHGTAVCTPAPPHAHAHTTHVHRQRVLFFILVKHTRAAVFQLTHLLSLL